MGKSQSNHFENCHWAWPRKKTIFYGHLMLIFTLEKSLVFAVKNSNMSETQFFAYGTSSPGGSKSMKNYRSKKNSELLYDITTEREQLFGMIPSIRNAQKSSKKRFLKCLFCATFSCTMAFHCTFHWIQICCSFFFVDSDVIDHSMLKDWLFFLEFELFR